MSAKKSVENKQSSNILRIPETFLGVLFIVWAYIVVKNYYAQYPVNIDYLNHILSVEHQNINEREHIQEHEERKNDELKFTGKESIEELAKGVTKKI